MTTPSRTSEINRRRTRHEKIARLRRQYQMAASDADKDRILERLARLPYSMSREQFLAPLNKKD